MKVCIIGAGPAGLYVAKNLLKRIKGLDVRLVDQRASPFGLLRYGVAPDHPEVKNTSNSFVDIISKNDNVKFYGGVQVDSFLLKQLERSHDAVVITTGFGAPKQLQIPGFLPENNCFTSQDFVGWYNNDELAPGIKIDLSSVKRVAVLGHGNVALDVARILLKNPNDLQNSDISQTALAALRNSSVKSIDIIGRRGPLQSSFTISELREMFALESAKHVSVDNHSKCIEEFAHVWSADRRWNRLFQMVHTELNKESIAIPASRSWSLRYFLQPKVVFGSQKINGMLFEHTAYRNLEDPPTSVEQLRDRKVIGTGKFMFAQYDMAISCIGYQPSVDFDFLRTHSGSVLNDNGRVKSKPGLYVAGWAATGAEGELNATRISALVTVESLYNDYLESKLPKPSSGEDISVILKMTAKTA